MSYWNNMTPKTPYPSIMSLRALEALDRLGTATAAAQELDITQSAISRQISTLESQLKTPLVLRKKQRLTLTPDGISYVRQVREALGILAKATLELTGTGDTGQLNIGILPSFGMRWLMPRLAEFAQLHPDVTLNLLTRLATQRFTQGDIDATIHFGKAVPEDADGFILKHEAMIAVALPTLIQDQTPDAIARLPLLEIHSRPEAWQDWFTKENLTLTPKPIAKYDQFTTIIQAALHGIGAALLPAYLAQEYIATGQLVVLGSGKMSTQEAYYFIWPKHRPTSRAMRVFKEWIATQADDGDALPR